MRTRESKTEKSQSGRGIIVDQFVQPLRHERAKQLRHSMTTAESVLWKHVRANQLGGLHWRRQQVIDGFIADFYCHAAGVVVEVDGGVHAYHTNYDTARDQVISSHNLLVMRFTNLEVLSNISEVLARILSECQRRMQR